MKAPPKLELKWPRKVKNWFRSGRWHKVYPKAGKTKLRARDMCIFKPDLLEVTILSVLKTVEKGIYLYKVRCNDGHVFPSYGNDLLVVKRYKPEFVARPKPEFVLAPKPKKEKPVLYVLWRKPKPRFIPPAKDVIARLSWWMDYGLSPNTWAFKDYIVGQEEQLEKDFWKYIEERKPRKTRRSKALWREQNPFEGIYTDRYRHPELVCIEWFDQLQQEKGNVSKKLRSGNGVVSPEKAVLPSRPKGKPRKAAGSRVKKGQSAGSSNHTKAPHSSGRRKGKQARPVRAKSRRRDSSHAGRGRAVQNHGKTA